MKIAVGLLLFIFHFQLLTLQAQVLKVTSDTAQTVCPGNAESCMIHYTMHLSPYSKDIAFNYLYINGLRQDIGLNNGNLWADTISNTYTIRSYKSSMLTGPCQHYCGEAMIIYTYKGKADSIIIQHFVQAKPITHSQ